MSAETRRTRVAGGTGLKRQDVPELTLGFKDKGASEAGLDIQAGLMQAADSIHNLQLGEGLEEIAYVDPDTLEEDVLTVYMADVITELPDHEHVLDRGQTFYQNSLELAGEALPDAFDIEFVDSTTIVPAERVLDEITRYGDWETGVVEQPPVNEDDTWSRELLNYLEVDVPEDAVPVDFEYVEAGDDSFYLDRIDFEVNIETGETTVYRGGDALFNGMFDGAMAYMENSVTDDAYTFDEHDFDYGDPFNVKSAAAVAGIKDVDPHDSIQQYLPPAPGRNG